MEPKGSFRYLQKPATGQCILKHMEPPIVSHVPSGLFLVQAACSTHPILLDFIALIHGEEYKLLIFSNPDISFLMSKYCQEHLT